MLRNYLTTLFHLQLHIMTPKDDNEWRVDKVLEVNAARGMLEGTRLERLRKTTGIFAQ
jgi:hypothetical protein